MNQKFNHTSKGPVDLKAEELVLDKANIRFGHLGTKLTESEIQDHLWEEEDCRVLYKQIVRDRQVLMPLYVVKDGKKYVARDGNRRLTTIRKINEDISSGKLKDFKKEHFGKLRCFVLEGTDKDVELFLGSIHVAGPKEWATANKAMHVYNLVEDHKMQFSEVGEELGMTKGRIETYYKAFKAVNTYGKKFGKEGAKYLRKYSYFDELYKSKDLRAWLDEDDKNLERFMGWLHGGKMATYMDVRRLRDMIKLGNPGKTQAITAVEKGGQVEKVHKNVISSNDKDNWKDMYAALKSLKKFPASNVKEALADPKKAKIVADVVSTALGIQSLLDSLRRGGAAVA